MFEGLTSFFKKVVKNNPKLEESSSLSKDAAKERLHLVLVQDRANVSADFLDLMKQEIIDVIKKYVDIDENEIDVRLTNQANDDGTNGAPALYANIPIINIKNGVIGEKMREQGAQMTIDDLVNAENKEKDSDKDKEKNKKEVKEEPPKVIELGESKKDNNEEVGNGEEKVDELEEFTTNNKQTDESNNEKESENLAADEKKSNNDSEEVDEKTNNNSDDEEKEKNEDGNNTIEDPEDDKLKNEEDVDSKDSKAELEDKDVKELEKIEELIGENIDSLEEQIEDSINENTPEEVVTHKKNRKKKTSKRK